MESTQKYISTNNAETIQEQTEENYAPLTEIEQSRRELTAAGIDATLFSDSDLVMALQQKKEIEAYTIVPVVVDWLIKKNFILSGERAGLYLKEKLQNPDYIFYKEVGSISYDRDGKYFMVAVSTQDKKTAKVYKVYTDGKIKELWLA